MCWDPLRTARKNSDNILNWAYGVQLLSEASKTAWKSCPTYHTLAKDNNSIGKFYETVLPICPAYLPRLSVPFFQLYTIFLYLSTPQFLWRDSARVLHHLQPLFKDSDRWVIRMAIKLQEIKTVTSFSIFPLGAEFFTHRNLKKNDHQLRFLVQTFYLRWPCYCIPGNHMGWISAYKIYIFFLAHKKILARRLGLTTSGFGSSALFLPTVQDRLSMLLLM